MDTALYIEKRFGTHKGNPHKLEGFAREDMYRLFAELGFKVGAEIGVEKGKNALKLFEIIPDLRLYAVDPYMQHSENSEKVANYLRVWDENYLQAVKKQAQKRLQGKNVVFIEKFSQDATHDIIDGSLDFVYIDGDHSYDFVMQDIILWSKKVHKGGIISGHDYYYNSNKVGRESKVTQAVNDYAQAHGIKFYITSEGKYVKKGDIPPSWFFCKTEEVYPNVVGA